MSGKYSIVCAYSKSNRGIGYKGQIPWSIPQEMKYFRDLTIGTNQETHQKQNAVIMGRKTWESIPSKYKPLSNRKNYIVSTQIEEGSYLYDKQSNTLQRWHPEDRPDVIEVGKTYKDVISHAINNPLNNECFVIGGSQLYNESFKDNHCSKLYLTEIDNNNNCEIESDTFLDPVPQRFKLISESEQTTENHKLRYLTYEDWTDLNSQENIYLNLLKEIQTSGEYRSDRTGIGTKSVFGKQMRFSLENNTIPLLTTKRVYWKGVVEELLFFLRGDHDNRKLQSANVHIWDGNTSREYLDKYNKQHIETHDLGLAYGVQWRASGASLGNINTDYRGKGIDQLKEVIDMIKSDPYSRRLIINAWNVPQLKDMALVPCHMMYQFYVSNPSSSSSSSSSSLPRLSCMMTQRSCDMFLGVPFNIASCALLTHIIARTCNMEPHEIIMNLGDAHIYQNHINQVQQQLDRSCFRFPTINISKPLNNVEDIESLTFDDINLQNYHSWPTIKAHMAV